jgi:hypothetical protein
MKKIFPFLVALVAFVLNVSAQADSVFLGAGNQDMVFYNLQNGTKTVASNTDWHLAFSIRNAQFPSNTLQGTTIRTNEANGVAIYEIPGFTADSFSVNVDTTGYASWNRVYDADSVLDEGAMNTGKNISTFDYGWGAYGGSPNHDVVGKKIYLIMLPNGALKKFLVDELDRDTAWVIRYANIDNSDLQTVQFGKAAYAGKNFVYFNLSTNQLIDKEPLSSQWDLLFTKYVALDVMPGTAYSVVGVLANKGRTIYERANVPVSDNSYPAAVFSPAMNTIGWDWKEFDNQTLTYSIADSLTYFVQSSNGVHKLYFTDFGGSSTGRINFNVENFGFTSVNDLEKHSNLIVYPNPTKGTIQLATDREILIESVTLFNVNGAIMLSMSMVTSSEIIDINHLDNGLYFLRLNTKEGTQVQKILLQR